MISIEKANQIKTSAKTIWKNCRDQNIRVVAYHDNKVSTACRSNPNAKVTDRFIDREVDSNKFAGLVFSLGKGACNLEALCFRNSPLFEKWQIALTSLITKKLYPIELKLGEDFRPVLLLRCGAHFLNMADNLAKNELGNFNIIRRGEGSEFVLPRNEDGTYKDSPPLINEKITSFELETMLRIAISFDKKPVFDSYDAIETEDIVELRDVLARNNWRKVDVAGEIEYWCEPGEKGVSACVQQHNGHDILTYLGRNIPLVQKKSYTATQLLAHLEHSGNLKIAHDAIEKQLERTGNLTPSGKISLGLKKEQEDGVPNDPTCIHFVNAKNWLAKEVTRPAPIISDILDIGDKCAIIGPPKIGKTFFILQLAVAIASGRNTLGLTIPTARRVAFVNMEIRYDQFHRRVRSMAKTFRDPEPLLENLSIANLKGTGATLDSIGEAVQPSKPEVLIIDPLYKLYQRGHNENSAGDTASLMGEIERLAKRVGCAVIIVHHDSKFGGDGKRTSRGAGSGLLSRDYDSALFLTPHANVEKAVVVGHVLRNHPYRSDLALRWMDKSFILDDTLPTIEETAATRRADRQRGVGSGEIIEKVAAWFSEGPIASSVLQNRIIDEFRKGKNAACGIVTLMCDNYGYHREKRQNTTLVFPPTTNSAPHHCPPSSA